MTKSSSSPFVDNYSPHSILTHPLLHSFLSHFPQVTSADDQLYLVQWSLLASLETFTHTLKIDLDKADVKQVESEVVNWIADSYQTAENRRKSQTPSKTRYFPDPYNVYPDWYGNEEHNPNISIYAHPAKKLLDKWRLNSAAVDRAVKDVQSKTCQITGNGGGSAKVCERIGKVNWVPKRMVDEFTQTDIIQATLSESDSLTEPPLSNIPTRKISTFKLQNLQPHSNSDTSVVHQLKTFKNAKSRNSAPAKSSTAAAFFVPFDPRPVKTATQLQQPKRTATSKQTTSVYSNTTSPRSWTIPQDRHTSERALAEDNEVKKIVEIAKNILSESAFVGCFDIVAGSTNESDEEKVILEANEEGMEWMKKEYIVSKETEEKSGEYKSALSENGVDGYSLAKGFLGIHSDAGQLIHKVL
ncbi:hypothetical protein BKA69DRAFT_1042682 [Paraphysoderma sedebokerense]|nr:hypothetical protein BKA69DRAFT_1042682 [Paraphysoderma sedebokerense]